MRPGSAVRVMIPGCAGRMGKALVQALASVPDMRLSGATEAPGSSALGQDAGTVAGLPPLGIAVTDRVELALDGAEGVIDFTVPAATAALHVEETVVPTLTLPPAAKTVDSAPPFVLMIWALLKLSNLKALNSCLKTRS